MEINSSSVLLSQISQSKGFKLEDGQLKTQGRFERFLQSIGDFFGSMRASSRADIAARNANIEAKMLDILRNDEPVVSNLAASPIDYGAVIKKAPLSNENTVKILLPLLIKQFIVPEQQKAAMHFVDMAIADEAAMNGSHKDLVNLISKKVDALKSNPLTVKEFNGFIQRSILTGLDFPPKLQTAADEALAQVKTTWRNEIDLGDTIQESIGDYRMTICAEIENQSDFITEEKLASLIKEKTTSTAQRNMVGKALATALSSANRTISEPMMTVVNSMLDANPDFAKDLKTCKNPMEAELTILAYMSNIYEYAESLK